MKGSGSKQMGNLAVAVSGKAFPHVSACFPFSVPSKILVRTLCLFVLQRNLCLLLFLVASVFVPVSAFSEAEGESSRMAE